VKRIAFNRLLEGQPRQTIVTSIRLLKILTNARYIRSAIEEAAALIKSQKKLVKLYCKETTWKVDQFSHLLKTYQHKLVTQHQKPSERQINKIKGLHRRFQKVKIKQKNWTEHKKHNTIPPVIFGGKQQFYLYQQRKISKEEWQQRRNNGLYCVGETDRQGNANLRVSYKPRTDSFAFSMLLDQWKRNNRLTAPLYVPSKFKEIFTHYSQGTSAYTARVLLHEEGKIFRVLIVSEHENSTLPNAKGIAGVDLNPTGVAVTLLYPDGNFRRSKWFACPDLMYARKWKRNWLINNLLNEVLAWITSYKINTLAIESLDFSKKYGTSRKFNRVKANFVYRKLVKTVHSNVIRKNFYLKEINPAFTSVIGELKYAKCYGLNNHQAAALVIGRRALGFAERLYGHVNGKRRVLVVPPLEGWTSKQITGLSRDIDEFTARSGKLTGHVNVGTPTLLTRRQGSRGGIVPRSHTPTPGTGAPVTGV